MSAVADRPNLTAAKAKIAAIKTFAPMASLSVYPRDAEIYLDGEIGPEWAGMIDAPQVIDALKQMNNRHATIYLNSDGGIVDVGVAIANAIRSYQPGVTIVVTGMAASIAGYILMAATKRIVYSDSAFMLHNPWGGTVGSAEEMRRAAELLDQYGERLIAAYAERSGKSAAEIRNLMDAETYYFGSEIVDAGFADELHPDSIKQPAARMTVLRAKILRARTYGLGIDQPAAPSRFPRRDHARSVAAKLKAKLA